MIVFESFHLQNKEREIAMTKVKEQATIEKVKEKEQVTREKEQVIKEREQVTKEKEQVMREKEQIQRDLQLLTEESQQQIQQLRQQVIDFIVTSSSLYVCLFSPLVVSHGDNCTKRGAAPLGGEERGGGAD